MIFDHSLTQVFTRKWIELRTRDKRDLYKDLFDEAINSVNLVEPYGYTPLFTIGEHRLHGECETVLYVLYRKKEAA